MIFSLVATEFKLGLIMACDVLQCEEMSFSLVQAKLKPWMKLV